jgi:adenosylmethionine-8-amino-7-oxononanoate aminotransferase
MDEHQNLEKADKSYIWHPFTQMQDWEKERPIIISDGEGCYIRDIYGKQYIDGVSSIWVNIFVHRKQEIDDAIREQLSRISHSTLLGLSNIPAIRLAEKLVRMFKKSFSRQTSALNKVFYSDNGSTAVEVGLKMAFQYWKNKSVEGKHSFLSLKNAYHGDTLGAVSVGGIDIFHKTFEPILFKTYRAPSPYCYRCASGMDYPECGFACIKKMEEILKQHHTEIAGVIIEPLIQAAGGMIVAPSGYLARVRELCTDYNVLLIADEVATGFGRTGRMFACEHEDVLPDIVCLSKGITGGYMPLAATLASEEIYNAFLGSFRELKTFFHGHSYTGNPLACAAACACLDLFEKEKILLDVQQKIAILETRLREMAELSHVGNVRNSGMMAGVELVKNKETKAPYEWEEKMGWNVAHHARDNGVFIRPLGNVIVIMPPLSISPETLDIMLKTIHQAIRVIT